MVETACTAGVGEGSRVAKQSLGVRRILTRFYFCRLLLVLGGGVGSMLVVVAAVAVAVVIGLSL